MIRKSIPIWTLGAALALALGMGPVGCGGSGGDDGQGGADGTDDEDKESGGSKGTGGKKGTGGNTSTSSGGSMGGETSSPSGGKGNTTTGGSGNVEDVKIEDLVTSLCAYEFNCCSEGELQYRLGSTAESVDECVKDFTYQLKESNAAQNPFPPGTATGLLGTLAYTVDLTRVDENPQGIAECMAHWETMKCPELPTGAVTYCEPGGTGKDPCSLDNLFKPALAEGQACTIALTEGGTNDIECKTGTTCLAASDPDNPNGEQSVCVRRGVGEEPCNADKDCDFNFYCSKSGDCTPKGDEGDSCSFNDANAPVPGDEDAGCMPGLSCSPETEKCVAYCEESFPCSVNAQCPKDFVCAPATVGNDSVSWKTCQPTGKNANARCDEDADCESNRYCDGSVCQSDKSINDGCVRDAMCESGSFCDTATSDEYGYPRTPSVACTGYFQASEPCFPTADPAAMSNGCASSASLCLYDAETDGRFECTKNLKKAGDFCNTGNLIAECKPGLSCEVVDVTSTPWLYVCTEGAGAKDDCDDLLDDDEALSCGQGLLCVEGECIAQLEPGEDCEDPDVPGTGKPTLCLNSACVENWDQNGVDWICSDAPIPVDNSGDGLTCGGD